MKTIMPLSILVAMVTFSLNARAAEVEIRCGNSITEIVINAEGTVSANKVDFDLYKMEGYSKDKLNSVETPLKFYNFTIESEKTYIADLNLGLGFTIYTKLYDTTSSDQYKTYGLVIQTQQASHNSVGQGFTISEFFTGIHGGGNSDLVLGNHFNLIKLPTSKDLLTCAIFQK